LYVLLKTTSSDLLTKLPPQYFHFKNEFSSNNPLKIISIRFFSSHFYNFYTVSYGMKIVGQINSFVILLLFSKFIIRFTFNSKVFNMVIAILLSFKMILLIRIGFFYLIFLFIDFLGNSFWIGTSGNNKSFLFIW
jgi:hypothetical protein